VAVIEKKEIYGLQYLRGIAALLVVVHHTIEMNSMGLPEWTRFIFAMGVDIFFVLSGFIMVYTAFPAGRGISPLTFLKKRVQRIYPLYWACFAMVVVIMSLDYLANNVPSVESMVSSFFLLPSHERVIFVAWTLEYEMYFYALFALSLGLKTTRLQSTLLACGLLGALYIAGSAIDMGYLSGFFANAIVFEFLFGMGLGLLFTETRFKGASKLFLIPAIGLVVCSGTLAADLTGDQGAMTDTTRLLLWGGAGLILCAVFVRFKKPKTIFGKFLSYLGDSSYSLYLTHIFWMAAYGLVLRKLYDFSLEVHWQILLAMAVLILCYVSSWLSYRLFEVPVSQYLRQNSA
jgi:peptidoglycan/LPS O-acetylase OafA/YrhL